MTHLSRTLRPASISSSAIVTVAVLWLAWHGWRGLNRVADRLATWHAHARERQALASLDERMLRDIGLTRDDVRREAIKPFWER